MRYITCLCLVSLTVVLAGCSRGEDDRDGQYVTDADGQHFHPRIPFPDAVITSEAQKLMDDFVAKHRADGVIQNVKIESAKVDASNTGILSGSFAFSGQATVTLSDRAPFTVGFRERISGSFMPNNHRLLDQWWFPDRSWSAITSAYVSGLDSWRAALTSDKDPNNVGFRLAEALSIAQLISDLKNHADPSALEGWKRANAVAWDKRTLINLPLAQ